MAFLSVWQLAITWTYVDSLWISRKFESKYNVFFKENALQMLAAFFLSTQYVKELRRLIWSWRNFAHTYTDECQGIHILISQHWFRKKFGAVSNKPFSKPILNHVTLLLFTKAHDHELNRFSQIFLPWFCYSYMDFVTCYLCLCAYLVINCLYCVYLTH